VRCAGTILSLSHLFLYGYAILPGEHVFAKRCNL
jgi:hypothetical protein